MRFSFERADYGQMTRIVADNCEPGMARIRALCDLPDNMAPDQAAERLLKFAADIELMSKNIPPGTHRP